MNPVIHVDGLGSSFSLSNHCCERLRHLLSDGGYVVGHESLGEYWCHDRPSGTVRLNVSHAEHIIQMGELSTLVELGLWQTTTVSIDCPESARARE